MTGQLRVLELYAGIGGASEALASQAKIAVAVEINERALAVYQRNFPHRSRCGTIESLPASFFQEVQADLWWLSPPCQPFTRRGERRDLDDPRCDSFVHVVRQIDRLAPKYVALENVPEFAGSRAHTLLRETLDRRGYRVLEVVVCPSELGLPNRRRRFYLVAGQTPLAPWLPLVNTGRPTLRELLDPEPDPALVVEPAIVGRYAQAMDFVDADDPGAMTSCFTAAYGRSPVRSGSYLRDRMGTVRRFSPGEILRLLGFGRSYTLPEGLAARLAWPLLGNSLSIPAVRRVLACVPEFAGLRQSQ
ncbi:MAG: DNA cytosine methyltransferase [Pirellulaceae bacterium]|nr:DNA cytosine methyltransferase [Pirellulaceae bacterium]